MTSPETTRSANDRSSTWPPNGRRRPRSAAGQRGPLGPAFVAAAREILETEGLDAVTSRAVAQRVGVSSAAVYLYHQDMPSLCIAVAMEGLSELSARLRAARAPGPDAALGEMALAYVMFARQRPALYRLISDCAERQPTGWNAALEALEGTGPCPLFRAALSERGEAASPGSLTVATVALSAALHGLADMASAGWLARMAVTPAREAELYRALLGPILKGFIEVDAHQIIQHIKK